MLVVLAGIGWCAVAQAQVYRCTAANGSVSFQDHACAAGQRQTVVNVPSRAPPGYVPPPVATVAPPASAAADVALPPLPPPPAPLPELYACVGAVNGKPYLVRTPTPPYLVPLGVLGYPPQSLSQAYGPQGGAGMSAPELSHPRIGGPRIGAGLTRCRITACPQRRRRCAAMYRRNTTPTTASCAWPCRASSRRLRRVSGNCRISCAIAGSRSGGTTRLTLDGMHRAAVLAWRRSPAWRMSANDQQCCHSGAIAGFMDDDARSSQGRPRFEERGNPESVAGYTPCKTDSGFCPRTARAAPE